MSISKPVTESLDQKIMNLKKLSNVKVTDHEPDTFNRLQLWRISANSSYINKAWENTSENIKISVKKWEQHKSWFMK
jgi:phosphoserine aminotransferase